MSNRKKIKHTKKEEQQADKVVKIVIVSFLVLAFIMLVGYSFLG